MQHGDHVKMTGRDGLWSATEEDAESADVEPFPADATHAAEFDNLLAASHQTVTLRLI